MVSDGALRALRTLIALGSYFGEHSNPIHDLNEVFTKVQACGIETLD